MDKWLITYRHRRKLRCECFAGILEDCIEDLYRGKPGAVIISVIRREE